MPQDPRQPDPPDDRQWSGTVNYLGAMLREFNKEAEDAFLGIAERLHDFSERSAEISRISLSMSKVMGGQEIRGAIMGIRGMVDHLRQLFQEAESQSARNLDALKAVDRELRLVHDDLEALRETSRNLRMLGLSTKIQSTRTGRNIGTFMQLGEDISQMSAVISAKADELIDQAVRLAELVEEVFSSLKALKSKQQLQTVSVLSGAREITDSLAAISVSSQAEYQRISHWSEEIERSLRDVVVSIQYQDITRQSLDKVRQDLEGLLEMIRTRWREGASTEGALPVGLLVAWACTNHGRCLKEAGDRAADEIRKMLSSLRGVMVNIADMSQVTGLAIKESTRFLGQLEKGMGSITSFLAEVVESGREMAEAMNSLAATVSGMSAFTDDIELISSDVELISLNARIRAAQTGSQGAGMGVIAGAVHQTANDSHTYRQSLLGKLQAITRSADALRSEMEKASKGEETRLDQLVRELGVLLDALRIMQRRTVSSLSSMDSRSAELSLRISQTLESVTLHTRAGQVVGSLVRDLDRMAEEAMHSVTDQQIVAFTQGRVSEEALRVAGPAEKLALAAEFLQEEFGSQCFGRARDGSSAAGEVTMF